MIIIFEWQYHGSFRLSITKIAYGLSLSLDTTDPNVFLTCSGALYL